VLVLRGPCLTARVSDSDPGGKNEGKPAGLVSPLDKSEEAGRTARALQKFLDLARKRLDNHPVNKKRVSAGLLPANAVLTRGGGIMTTLTPIAATYNGLKGAVISGEATVLAIAKMAGFHAATHASMTGSYDFNPIVKARMALDLIRNYDLVLIHVKAPDLAGHDGRWDLKKETIERVDSLVGTVRSIVECDTYIAVTADHSTPCRVGEHSGDPVPSLIWGPGIRTDSQETFGERTCAKGGLGRITGNQFFHSLLDHMGFMPKFGA
ncbi:MAG: phosphoglycerate mutase, partial [Peptococcaceae bacterium]|nr:phosphoglycerate mutase [Peptococcaceae bacterium]